MFTLADLRKNADDDTTIWTGTDQTAPDGTFLATTKMLGLLTTYLLSGTVDDENATILGRIEYQGTIDSPKTIAYAGSGIKGGRYLGSGEDEAMFAAMVRLAQRASAN